MPITTICLILGNCSKIRQLLEDLQQAFGSISLAGIEHCRQKVWHNTLLSKSQVFSWDFTPQEYGIVYMKIFDGDKLEKLLVANWTQFLDSSRLMAFVLQKLQENAGRLDIISSGQIKSKGIKITLSRFHISGNGFVIWIEFNAPVAHNRYAEGTMELFLTLDGQFNLINLIGNIN